MENKKELLNELENGFSVMKKQLGFKADLEEIDNIFFVRDSILKQGFVSEILSRQLCGRIVETYLQWVSYLHNKILPTQDMLSMNESKVFNENEKKDIMKLMKDAMALVSRNSLIGLTKDKSVESKFIDDAVGFWKKSFCPKLIEITRKINDYWKGK